MKKRINITLEDEVVRRVDRFADEHYTSRSGAITMLIVDATDRLESVAHSGKTAAGQGRKREK
ncbi:MAG: type II toxin-antitoxin system HicB family antitoxin [Eubacterium sp.]|nr:type II toxin-antitoxin system HicB family antitoxin [Eubacterium sp.]